MFSDKFCVGLVCFLQSQAKFGQGRLEVGMRLRSFILAMLLLVTGGERHIWIGQLLHYVQ